MTAGDIYTIAGSAGTRGTPATAARPRRRRAEQPASLALDAAGDLYIADDANNRIQEIAAATGTQWGQSDDRRRHLHRRRQRGRRRRGTPATAAPPPSALMANPDGIAIDPAGDLYITDTPTTPSARSPPHCRCHRPPPPDRPAPAIAPAAARPAVTITQPGGAQVTFYPQSGGACASALRDHGQVLRPARRTPAPPSPTAPALALHLQPRPRVDDLHLLTWPAQLTSETDTAGDTLTITYSSPPRRDRDRQRHLPVDAPRARRSPPRPAAPWSSAASGTGAGHLRHRPDGPARGPTPTTPVRPHLGHRPDGQRDHLHLRPGLHRQPAARQRPAHHHQPERPARRPDAGDATVNVYNALGQVTSQTDPMGYKTTFNYCVNAAAGDCMDPATGTGLVTVTDPDGNTTVYDYDQGTLAADIRVAPAATLTSENDYEPRPPPRRHSGGTLLDTSPPTATATRPPTPTTPPATRPRPPARRRTARRHHHRRVHRPACSDRLRRDRRGRLDGHAARRIRRRRRSRPAG